MNNQIFYEADSSNQIYFTNDLIVLFARILIINFFLNFMKSSLKLISSTPLGKQQLTKIKTIWQSLQNNHESDQFRNPVDFKAMGLYDYPKYIKYPMDLGTVHRKLRQNHYRTVEEVLDDIQLIWDNCKTYNLPVSWIYTLAERLERFFKKMIASYLPNIVLEHTKKRKEQPREQALVEKVDEEVSHQDKLAFIQKLKLLSPQNLKTVIETVSQHCPEAFQQDENGKARLLIDNLNLSAFEIASEKTWELTALEKKPSKKLKFY